MQFISCPFFDCWCLSPLSKFCAHDPNHKLWMNEQMMIFNSNTSIPMDLWCDDVVAPWWKYNDWKHARLHVISARKNRISLNSTHKKREKTILQNRQEWRESLRNVCRMLMNVENNVINQCGNFHSGNCVQCRTIA